MSLFRRRKKSSPRPASPSRQSEPEAPKLVAPVEASEVNEIKAKVQAEVCAIMSRTILEQMQSSEARAPANDELLRRQAVNRLYADVLYDLLSDGAPREIDPADRVQRWARGALEDWGRSQTAMSSDMVREREALAQSVLEALTAAARDETLRTAAVRRVEADQRLASGG